MNMQPQHKPLSPWHFAGLLALVVLVIYGRACTFDFLLWDDPTHVVDNRLVNPPAEGALAKIWREPYCGLYIPISYSVFAAESAVARRSMPGEVKTRPNPAVFHAVSLLLHGGCVLLVFVLLRRLCGHDAGAFAGALLFALHPLQVESVAWVSETRGLLCAFFSLLAIFLFLSFLGNDAGGEKTPKGVRTVLLSSARYGLATLAFAAACLSKPAAVAVPLVVAVLAIGWLRHRPLKTLAFLSPWFAAAIYLALMTKRLQPDMILSAVSPYWARPMLAGDALAFYAYKLATPILLVPDYGRSPAAVMGHWTFYATWMIPVVLVAAFCAMRTRRVWLVATGVFACWLLPVLGFVPFEFQRFSTVADRYVYLAMLGPAFALAWYLSQPRSRAAVTAVVAVLCVLAGLTVNHVSHWRNDDSLLDHTLAVNPTSVMGNNNRGFILSEQNKPDKYREAVVFFQMALKTDPMHGESHLNLGWALASIGDIGRAKEELEKARILMPGEPWAHFNLGCVALFVENDAEEAARYFENAVALDPEFLKAHVNLAQAQMKLERFDDAQSSWQTALSLAHPDSREARDIRRSMEAARKERK